MTDVYPDEGVPRRESNEGAALASLLRDVSQYPGALVGGARLGTTQVVSALLRGAPPGLALLATDPLGVGDALLSTARKLAGTDRERVLALVRAVPPSPGTLGALTTDELLGLELETVTTLPLVLAGLEVGEWRALARRFDPERPLREVVEDARRSPGDGSAAAALEDDEGPDALGLLVRGVVLAAGSPAPEALARGAWVVAEETGDAELAALLLVRTPVPPELREAARTSRPERVRTALVLARSTTRKEVESWEDDPSPAVQRARRARLAWSPRPTPARPSLPPER